MKDESQSPMQYGWLDTMEQHETTTIPWNKRGGCYAFAQRHGIKITIRKQSNGQAKVIRLEPS
jgi:hypothetical protein